MRPAKSWHRTRTFAAHETEHSGMNLHVEEGARSRAAFLPRKKDHDLASLALFAGGSR